jgi:hypothetical protein
VPQPIAKNSSLHLPVSAHANLFGNQAASNSQQHQIMHSQVCNSYSHQFSFNPTTTSNLILTKDREET